MIRVGSSLVVHAGGLEALALGGLLRGSTILLAPEPLAAGLLADSDPAIGLKELFIDGVGTMDGTHARGGTHDATVVVAHVDWDWMVAVRTRSWDGYKQCVLTFPASNVLDVAESDTE